MWTLEDKCLLHIVLEKADNMKWWTCILKGDPEIDTQKIVPEVVTLKSHHTIFFYSFRIANCQISIQNYVKP
jgi:hypothetical protein